MQKLYMSTKYVLFGIVHYPLNRSKTLVNIRVRRKEVGKRKVSMEGRREVALPDKI